MARTLLSISLLATCKRLEEGGADIIAIPCNTAHAFVEKIDAQLNVPILNMLYEVRAHIQRFLPNVHRVGLLATTGTVATGVYHEAFSGSGIELLVPDEVNQARVMAAIYGDTGVKSGHTTGRCSDDLTASIKHMQALGAQAVILGCTELPLIELTPEAVSILPLVDPTSVFSRQGRSLPRRTLGSGEAGQEPASPEPVHHRSEFLSAPSLLHRPRYRFWPVLHVRLWSRARFQSPGRRCRSFTRRLEAESAHQQVKSPRLGTEVLAGRE